MGYGGCMLLVGWIKIEDDVIGEFIRVCRGKFCSKNEGSFWIFVCSKYIDLKKM